MGRRTDPPFHNPFAAAKKALVGKLRTWEATAARRRSEAVPSPPPPPSPPVGDDQTFQRAMRGVEPLASEPRVGAERAPISAPPRQQEDAEASARLADLVAGTGPFDISDTIEFVEGLAHGVDRRLLRRLRRGDFTLQGHLDLHGLTREEAKPAVERFMAASRAQGERCVLIIHGRGLNSKEKEPVLKPALVSWLSRGRIGRQVLAFCTARPPDGGAGAVYVLLRR